MKNLVLAVAFVLLTVAVSMARSYPEDPVSHEMVNGPSWSGLYSAALTVNSVAYNMTLFPVFRIFCPADAKIRITATSSKAGSVNEPIPGGQWDLRITHPETPFAIISGCTNGVLNRQPKNRAK